MRIDGPRLLKRDVSQIGPVRDQYSFENIIIVSYPADAEQSLRIQQRSLIEPPSGDVMNRLN